MQDRNGVSAMAFHTPNPELRAIEIRNGQLRAQCFAWLFRRTGGAIRRGLRALRRGFARATRSQRTDIPDHQARA